MFGPLVHLIALMDTRQRATILLATHSRTADAAEYLIKRDLKKYFGVKLSDTTQGGVPG